MDIGLQQVAQRCVNHAMPLQRRLGDKRRRDDAHGIMTAALMGMTDMPGAIVAYFQLQRMECGFQAASKLLGRRLHGSTLRKGFTLTRAYTPAVM